MKRITKVVDFPIAYKSAPKTVTKEEFYIALYNFMLEIKVIETLEQFEELTCNEWKYLNYFIERYVCFRRF